MATLRTIRKRITSVRNTRQITRAMKLVSAAKLRRAQDSVVSARPFAEKIGEVLGRIGVRVDVEAHPLLLQREVKRVEIVLVASDRGLCGGFNANILRKGEAFLLEREPKGIEVTVSVVGRKMREYFRRRKRELRRVVTDVRGAPDYKLASEIGTELIQRYLDGEVDEVYLLYSEFRSAISQRPTVKRVLPVARFQSAQPPVEEAGVDYAYEPSPQALLELLLPRYVNVQVHHALLESAASEEGARMTAMDSATNNASDMIDRLTLLYNRARQAAITKELVEIVSAAEAL
ncbi:MAG: ATP synthase F1 subunit gamma [Deltaproteobacteria bacterium]|nr:ATP synthase F1 subunit gamma [Deltaproteobacteria bacterium]